MAAAFACLLLIDVPRAAARGFPADVLLSVVSVLPTWPEDARRSEEPEGSAVAIAPGGYLVTNDHVLGKASEISVRFHDGRLAPAEIIGRDPFTDLALLRVSVDLPVPSISHDAVLGERVCAVGNQFGLGLSVTCGVVSALHRTGVGFNPIEDFIQTDAVVNPGGSGGALMDMSGRLVGVLSAIFTKTSDANIGVNFAASSRLVMRVVDDLRKHGRVKRVRHGLRVEALDQETMRTRTGARVVKVAANSPAEKAGFKPDDIITAIAGRRITKPSDISSAIHVHPADATLDVIYVRDGAEAIAVLALGAD